VLKYCLFLHKETIYTMIDTFPLSKIDNNKAYEAKRTLYGYVGAYIEDYKSRHKVSDSYIASAVGCSKQAIQSVRTGTAITSLSFIARISAVFGLSVADILIEGKRLRDEGLVAVPTREVLAK